MAIIINYLVLLLVSARAYCVSAIELQVEILTGPLQ